MIEKKISKKEESCATAKPRKIMNGDKKIKTCYKKQKQQFTVTRAYINSMSSRQVRLYYTKFTPKRKQATICIIHGYGQSSDNYMQTAQFFAKNNFVVNMIDFRGFGYSGGCRVNQPIKMLVSDIQNLLTRCCEMGLPTFILSHGYGCLLVFALLQQNPKLPLAGVIALSPLFKFPHTKKNSWLYKFFTFLSPSIFDGMIINNMINPTALTNNPLKIQQCISGVFNYQYVSLKMWKQYLQLSQKVCYDAYKLDYPLLFCYGGLDCIQSPQSLLQFYSNINLVKDKKIKQYPLGYHQLYNDSQAHLILQDVILWTQKHNKMNIKWQNVKFMHLYRNKRSNSLKNIAIYIILLITLILAYKRKNKCLKYFMKIWKSLILFLK